MHCHFMDPLNYVSFVNYLVITNQVLVTKLKKQNTIAEVETDKQSKMLRVCVLFLYM